MGELAKYQLQRDPGCQHALQRARATTRSSASSTSRICGSRTAAAWRYSERSPEKWLAVTGVPDRRGIRSQRDLAGRRPAIPPTTREYNGTIGLPFPNTEIAILDDDGQAVPLGEAGEIAIRGPQVMAGYWQRPDETAKVMTAGRLLQVGRRRRDGRAWLHQRSSIARRT